MWDIRNIVSSIQKIMRKDRGVDGDAQRIWQLSWMLFLKILDAKEKEYELLKDDYTSPMPAELQRRAWAEDDEGITGEELIDFINNTLFPKLRELSTSDKNKLGFIIKSVFEDSFNYMKSWVLMRQVINKLDEINFNQKADLHIFNDIYEKILNDLQGAGNAGEFYTPRAVTQFMVDMLDPQLGEKVFDPACGTWWFLTGTVEYIRKQQVKSPEDEAILQANIYGNELKQLPHLLCTTNMLLHGIEIPINIKHTDTLTKAIRDISPADQVDVLITNPPFGWQIAPGIKHNFPTRFQTSETASLFMAYIIYMLKPRGRAAVVLPDGILFSDNNADTAIKQELLEKCNLHTIVRLPNNVFAPYASVATNLLFFQYGESTKEIRYYEHQVPEGQKTYNKTNPIRLEEFDVEKDRWNNRKESEVARKVSIDEIKARNYNLDVKNPNKVEEVKELDTQNIIDQINFWLTQATNILLEISKK